MFNIRNLLKHDFFAGQTRSILFESWKGRRGLIRKIFKTLIPGEGWGLKFLFQCLFHIILCVCVCVCWRGATLSQFNLLYINLRKMLVAKKVPPWCNVPVDWWCHLSLYEIKKNPYIFGEIYSLSTKRIKACE